MSIVTLLNRVTIKEVLQVSFRRSNRTFYFNSDDTSQRFVISKVEQEADYYYMTAQGSHIKSGDTIKIMQYEQSSTFQVVDIEYYSEPSDMWIALLHKISN